MVVGCIWEYLVVGDWFSGWTSRLQPWGAVCMLSIFTWCKKTFPRVLVHIETLQTYLVWGLNPRPSLYVLMIWSLIHQVAIHKSTKFNMYPSPSPLCIIYIFNLFGSAAAKNEGVSAMPLTLMARFGYSSLGTSAV